MVILKSNPQIVFEIYGRDFLATLFLTPDAQILQLLPFWVTLLCSKNVMAAYIGVCLVNFISLFDEHFAESAVALEYWPVLAYFSETITKQGNKNALIKLPSVLKQPTYTEICESMAEWKWRNEETTSVTRLLNYLDLESHLIEYGSPSSTETEETSSGNVSIACLNGPGCTNMPEYSCKNCGGFFCELHRALHDKHVTHQL